MLGASRVLTSMNCDVCLPLNHESWTWYLHLASSLIYLGFGFGVVARVVDLFF